mgnify:FL=1
MRASDLLAFWRLRGLELAPHEGFRFGSPEVELTGALVCWLPTLDAIETARRQGCNLIVARDPFNFPPDYSGALIDHNLSDRVTLRRLAALVDAGVTVFCADASVDALMLDGFAEALSLREPEPAADGLHRIYPIDPASARALAARVRAHMDVDVLRVSGDLDRAVRRVALLWGNVGCAHYPGGLEPVLRLNPDAIVTGEVDEYPMRAAIDMGIPVIHVGHARSLTPGLRRFAALLREQFPGLRVEFYENPRPWAAL